MGLGVGLVYDARMLAHENEIDMAHPEKPARISSIYKRLRAAGVVDRCVKVDARVATTEELTTVHTETHVALMQEVSSRAYGKHGRKKLEGRYSSVYFNAGSSESALLAAGSVIEVATQVAEGKLAAGAAVVRPPGHHAEADEAMGFCLYNNVAIAAHILAHKKKELGVQKLLIVDWDVHHGNGTQHMFWNDPQVLYYSVHRSALIAHRESGMVLGVAFRFDNGSFYPSGNDGNYDKVGGCGGEGYNINVPWPHRNFGDADYLAAWEHVLMPVAREFNPDMVLISAGFDSAEGDPLGDCRVTPNGYYNLTRQLMELANGRIVLALEGGYNLQSISNSYLACMKALLGDPWQGSPRLDDMLPPTFPLLELVRAKLQDYWPVLNSKMKVSPHVSPTLSPSLPAEELSKLFLDEEELSLMSNEKRKKKMETRRLDAQADQAPVTDLVRLLSKLSTGEEAVPLVGYDGPSSSQGTRSADTSDEAQTNPDLSSPSETVDKSNSDMKPVASSGGGFWEAEARGGSEIAMMEIGQDDIEVILDFDGDRGSSHLGTHEQVIARLKGGDSGHFSSLEDEGANFVPVAKGSETATFVSREEASGESTDDVGEITSFSGECNRKTTPGSDQDVDTSSDNSTTGETSAVCQSKTSSYVWYGCYGSNMWKPRFMCYIQGGQVEGMGHPCMGCRDKTPPLASHWLTIPNRLFFGRKSTRMWGSGGVAFLNPVSEPGVSTQVRIYKITLEQFNDVFSQENREPLGKIWIFDSDIEALRKGPPTAPNHVFTLNEDNWYGTVKYFGEKDGLPILSFTCPVSHIEKFKSGEFNMCAPSASYHSVLSRGLTEELGFSEDEAHGYLRSAFLPKIK